MRPVLVNTQHKIVNCLNLGFSLQKSRSLGVSSFEPFFTNAVLISFPMVIVASVYAMRIVLQQLESETCFGYNRTQDLSAAS